MENKPVKYDPECKLWKAVLNEQIKSSDLDKNGNPRDSIKKKIENDENNENNYCLSNIKIITPYKQQIKPRMSTSLPNKSEFKLIELSKELNKNNFEINILKKELNDIENLYKIINEQKKEIYNLTLEKKKIKNDNYKLHKIINILSSTIKYLSNIKNY